MCMRERAEDLLGRVVSLRDRHLSRPMVIVVVLAVVGLMPHLRSISVAGVAPLGWLSINMLVITLVWATAAQAWNIMSGYTGQFSFGHAAFFGIGAYATIMAIREGGLSPWVGMLIGAGVAAVVGLVVGGLTFRYELQGHYFALATLAVAELLRYTFNSVPFLGEGSGFFKPFPREYGSEFGLAAFQFQSQEPYFYLIFTFLVVITAVAWVIRSSKLGLYFFAIRERERAAAAAGIPTVRYKLLAFGVSAALTAIPGAFWAMYFDTIRPDTVFAILINVEILLPAVVGGLGTVVGPIVGSFVVTPISEYARQSVDLHGLNNIIYGVVLILIVLYSPRGVVSWPARASDLVARWRSPTGGTDE